MPQFNQPTIKQMQIPQDIEAEKSLLGCLLIDPDAIIKIADFLLTKDFYKLEHQRIYAVCLELFEKRDSVDLLSISSRLKERKQLDDVGGRGYLTSLTNLVPTSSHVFTYAKIVQQKRILRELISTGYDISELGSHETVDTDILLDEAEKKIFDIAQGSMSQSFIQVKDTLEETWKRIDELSKQKGTLRGTPTGFKALDNILAGLQKSDLIILAARPSLGKSSLACDIAKNVAMKYKIPVGIFSLEMSRDQIIDRLLAAEADVDLWKLRTGHLSDQGQDNDFERIQRAMAQLSEAPIFIDDIIAKNLLQMRAMARRLMSQKGLGLIIIDYLQLMEHRNPNLNMLQQVTENSKGLKSMAKEFNIPILALSQLSRAVEQRMPPIPRLSDLRESGCLTGDALITRADTGERFKIKDLVGKTNIPVHSLDENWQVVEKKVSKVFSTGQKEVFELKTKSGFSIKASANHPFLRVNGWSRVDELKKGDRIATPQKIKISSPKNELNNDEVILLAHLLGDGCILPRQPYHYTSADWEDIQVVAKTAKKLFKIESKIIKQKNWWHVYLKSPYHLTHKTHHPITLWYEKLGLQRVRSYEKEMPEAVFSLSEKKVALFLKHLWATDGSISFRKCKKNGVEAKNFTGAIYYASTSLKLALSIKELLLRFGVRSKLSEVKKTSYRPCYHINIDGKNHQLNFLTKIGCYGERSKVGINLMEKLKVIKENTNLDVWPKEIWKFFIDPIRQEKNISWRELSAGIETSYCGSTLFKNGIGFKRMKRIATFLQSPTLKKMAQAEVFWDEIVSITPLGVTDVYDLTVPGTHNFVANGIIVENSVEQDADVVLFIHREDRYKENTERQGIADIIVAKHRNGPVGKIELFFDETRVTFRDIDKRF